MEEGQVPGEVLAVGTVGEPPWPPLAAAPQGMGQSCGEEEPFTGAESALHCWGRP